MSAIRSWGRCTCSPEGCVRLAPCPGRAASSVSPYLPFPSSSAALAQWCDSRQQHCLVRDTMLAVEPARVSLPRQLLSCSNTIAGEDRRPLQLLFSVALAAFSDPPLLALQAHAWCSWKHTVWQQCAVHLLTATDHNRLAVWHLCAGHCRLLARAVG